MDTQADPAVSRAHPKNAPGPKAHFFVGHLPERRKEPLRFFIRSKQQFGDVVRFRMGPTLVVHLVTDPTGVKHVLQDNQKNYIKGIGYDKLETFLGQGLLTSEGDFWRRQRKLAQPAFHRQRLIQLSKKMTQSTEALLSRWEKLAATGEAFDVAQEMMRLTLGIASKTLLGKDVSGDADEVGAAIRWLIKEGNRRILSITTLTEKLSPARRKLSKQSVETVDRVLYGIIAERRKNPALGEDDLLSMLMQMRDEDTGETMTDRQLRDEVMTIFVAGYETTGNALAWTWYLLSKHPEIERKLHQEVSSVLGGRMPTFDDLPKLNYTRMVLEESMRMYPPAWVISRQAVNEDEIGGFKIPKGSVVVLSSYVAHRDPKNWDNPEGFDPERFTEEKVAARPKYAYFPFGGGPRVCIGNGFAMMEAQLIVAAVAQKYRLNLVSGHPVEPEPLVTLRPKHGVTVTLSTQNK